MKIKLIEELKVLKDSCKPVYDDVFSLQANTQYSAFDRYCTTSIIYKVQGCIESKFFCDVEDSQLLSYGIKEAKQRIVEQIYGDFRKPLLEVQYRIAAGETVIAGNLIREMLDALNVD